MPTSWGSQFSKLFTPYRSHGTEAVFSSLFFCTLLYSSPLFSSPLLFSILHSSPPPFPSASLPILSFLWVHLQTVKLWKNPCFCSLQNRHYFFMILRQVQSRFWKWDAQWVKAQQKIFSHSFQHHEKITFILQATECLWAFIPDGTKSSNSP